MILLKSFDGKMSSERKMESWNAEKSRICRLKSFGPGMFLSDSQIYVINFCSSLVTSLSRVWAVLAPFKATKAPERRICRTRRS